jgi:hypothetical protein
VGSRVRFAGDVLEEDVAAEVLVEVEEAVLGGLGGGRGTSPCWRKVSSWMRISSWLKSLAMGAMILPKRVDLRKRWWLTVCRQGYV